MILIHIYIFILVIYKNFTYKINRLKKGRFVLLNKGFIGKLTGYLQRIFDEHFMFIMILFIINSLTTAWSLFDEDKIDVAIGYIFSVWLGSLIITCLIDLLPKRFLQKIVKTVLVIPIGLIFIGEFFTIDLFKSFSL